MQPEERRRLDSATRRSVAQLLSQIGGMRIYPVEERERLLSDIGFLAEDAAAVAKLSDVLAPRPEEIEWYPISCPIGWQPSVVTPVFYGYRDIDPRDWQLVAATGDTVAYSVLAIPPGRMRVFYPSLDGAPEDGPMLVGCGDYPLVVFLHGQCFEPDHHMKWFHLPAQLARSGYVVAVPELASGYPWEDGNPDMDLASDVIDWMRGSWQHRSQLLPPPATAIVGHSYGALLGARLARDLPVAAYASLSAPWSEWPSPIPRPLQDLTCPLMFMWGTGFDEFSSALSSADWAALGPPKHRIVSENASHWDYLPPGRTTCEGDRGPCNLVGTLASDYVATFLSRYLPPSRWSTLGYAIPPNLVPPEWPLTQEQEFFAGGHLVGLDQIDDLGPDCDLTHTWEAPTITDGEETY